MLAHKHLLIRHRSKVAMISEVLNRAEHLTLAQIIALTWHALTIHHGSLKHLLGKLKLIRELGIIEALSADL